VHEDRAVVLRDAPRVTIALVGVASPEPPLVLQVELEPAGEPPGASHLLVDTWLDSDGRALVRPRFTGRARVRLFLAFADRRTEVLAPGTERFLEIADAPGDQTLELRVDPTALAEATRRFAR
jgi:hypothetical protein